MKGAPLLWGLVCEGSFLFVPATGCAAEKRGIAVSHCPGLKETPIMENPEHTIPVGGRKQQWVQASPDQPGLLKRSSCRFPAGTVVNYSADGPVVLHWSLCLGNIFKAAALLGKIGQKYHHEKREDSSSSLSRAEKEALV